jgi:hypothetical protein
MSGMMRSCEPMAAGDVNVNLAVPPLVLPSLRVIVAEVAVCVKYTPSKRVRPETAAAEAVFRTDWMLLKLMTASY